ncbi:MAG TPA: hypothetical protein VHP38_17660 [Ruminiclostridium sp.]|nr:hypothetical protein [Ruminiclostridium sp.]
MMAEKKVWHYFVMGFVLIIIAAMAPSGGAAALNDLSAEYQLDYATSDGNLHDQFQVTADEKGTVQLIYPFISGGCIAINELKIQSVEVADNGVKTVNLLWNCDRGQPCKAYIPVQLRAGFKLPEPGKYLIVLWATETVGSEKINQLAQQEIEFKQ